MSPARYCPKTAKTKPPAVCRATSQGQKIVQLIGVPEHRPERVDLAKEEKGEIDLLLQQFHGDEREGEARARQDADEGLGRGAAGCGDDQRYDHKNLQRPAKGEAERSFLVWKLFLRCRSCPVSRKRCEKFLRADGRKTEPIIARVFRNGNSLCDRRPQGLPIRLSRERSAARVLYARCFIRPLPYRARKRLEVCAVICYTVRE